MGKIFELNTGYMRKEKEMFKSFQFDSFIVRHRLEYRGLYVRLIFRVIVQKYIVKWG